MDNRTIPRIEDLSDDTVAPLAWFAFWLGVTAKTLRNRLTDGPEIPPLPESLPKKTPQSRVYFRVGVVRAYLLQVAMMEAEAR